jgi:hypothetical protein
MRAMPLRQVWVQVRPVTHRNRFVGHSSAFSALETPR